MPPTGANARWRRGLASHRRRCTSIWAAHGLKPHLTKTFKLSSDPNFVAKVRDVVGLYLDPPDKALVLAVDEKRSYGEWIATDALAE